MGLCSKISLSQARKDLKYLFDNYGFVHDYCGGFCNTKVLVGILFGDINIKETIINNIQAYFTQGIDNPYNNSCTSDRKPDRQDKVVQEIIDRYGID